MTCNRPPPGWICTRDPGHRGPCAAWPVPLTCRRGVTRAECEAAVRAVDHEQIEVRHLERRRAPWWWRAWRRVKGWFFHG